MGKPQTIIGSGALALFATILAVYTPVLENDFVNWDDPSYVSDNPHIQELDSTSLHWMFTAFHAANWHPLTWLSHAVDYYFFKLNPWGHHLTSIVIHGLNCLLVFIITLTLMLRAKTTQGVQPLSGVKASFMVAAVTSLLFGLHPLHVESVAWISERKDLLCAFFFLLSIAACLRFTASAVKAHRRVWYGTSLLLFFCALMSKPMAVSLPFILLLLDIYPLNRLRHPFADVKILLEKAPFFVLSISSGILTVLAQQSGEAFSTLERLPLSGRLVIALRNLVFYLEKALVPIDLAPFYPLPAQTLLSDWRYLTSILAVIAITGVCVRLAQQGKLLFITSWSYYVVTLLPVIGIIQVGQQAGADRYTYLPLLSIFFLAAGGITRCIDRFGWLRYKVIFGGLLLCITLLFVFLADLTIKQIKVWRTSESLWNHEISIFPESVSFPYCSLGNAYLDKGLIHEAAEAYKKALAIEPHNAMAHCNLGVAYEKKGMLDEAIAKYNDAIAADPHYDLPHYNLGSVYDTKGMIEQSILEYKKALARNPHLARAHNNLGKVYAKKNLLDEAIAAYKRALGINPRYTEAYIHLGTAYLNKRMEDEAMRYLRQALALNPNDARAHFSLGAAYLRKNMLDEAIAECKKAVALNPDYAQAYYNLGSAYANKGMMEEAISHFRKALTINPDYGKAHYNLGIAYYTRGEYKLSLFHYTRAGELGVNVNPQILELLQSSP